MQISQWSLCIKLTSEVGVTGCSTRMKNANTQTANMNNDLKASTGLALGPSLTESNSPVNRKRS